MGMPHPVELHGLLATLLVRHPDNLLVVDATGEVLFANLAARRLLCRLPANDGRLPTPFLDFDVENSRVHCKDIAGEELIIELRAQPIDWHGTTAQFLVLHDVTAQVKQLRQLEHLVYRDPLTDLYNRRGLEHAIELLNASRAVAPQQIAVLYLDVNGLKQINDSAGHACGDAVIRETAGVLRHVLHVADIKARIGGDEFVALIRQRPNRSLATVMQQLQHEIQRRNRLSDRLYTLSLSIGSLQLPAQQRLVMEEILAQADQRMYLAKQQSYANNLSMRNRANTPMPAKMLAAMM